MVSVHIDHHRRLAFRTLNKLSHCRSVRPLVMLIRSVFVDTGRPDRITLLIEDIFDFVSSFELIMFTKCMGSVRIYFRIYCYTDLLKNKIASGTIIDIIQKRLYAVVIFYSCK